VYAAVPVRRLKPTVIQVLSLRDSSPLTTLLLLFVALFLASCGSKISDATNEKNVSGGKTIIESGTLEAVNNKVFILPRYSMYWYQMRIIGIVEHGKTVNKGDSIIQIDPSNVNKSILEREINLETQLANLEKMQVQQANQISDLESRIRSETASFNLKKIELESSQFETERQRAIKQLEFKQAEITLAKEKRKLELAKIVIANDEIIQDIRIQQIESDLESFRKIVPMLTIRSTEYGVFQRGINWRNGSMLNAGDEVYPGQSMGNVPELKLMKVNTFINENDFLKIKTGQKVIVRLDALPEIRFNGEIAYIGKLCRQREEKSRQKIFDVEVKMLQPDERLKPGMTVSCEFLTNH
jgi:multidrug efflux pump subunit AcrA (membrane-fusion protein)